MQIHIKTPCIPSARLSRLLNRDVFLKLENCQPTGSFKLRGIGALCREAARKRAKHLVSSSGGNAGLAAAFAARKLGLALKVFVPTTTPDFMQKKIMGENAHVVIHGLGWDDAHAAAMDEMNQ